MSKKKLFALLVGGVLVVAALAGCGPSGTDNDKSATDKQLKAYQDNGQNIPLYQWSQYRQTMLDVENAQVTGEATTTFFFNLGVRDPYFVCPSIGFPVPADTELTNPQQNVGSQGAVIGMMDPNGTYPGPTAGTYVICVAPNGTKFYHYAEPEAHTVGGPAHWDAQKGIVLDGAPSIPVTTKK